MPWAERNIYISFFVYRYVGTASIAHVATVLCCKYSRFSVVGSTGTGRHISPSVTYVKQVLHPTQLRHFKRTLYQTLRTDYVTVENMQTQVKNILLLYLTDRHDDTLLEEPNTHQKD
jgi:hypothetical protein